MCAAAGNILPEQKHCFDSQADAADVSACFWRRPGKSFALKRRQSLRHQRICVVIFSEEGEAVCGIFVSFNVLLNYLNNSVN